MSDHFAIRHSFYEPGDVDNVGLIRIVGDGNCLFRAISYCLYVPVHLSKGVVRKNIVEHVLTEWNRFSVYVTGQRYESVVVIDSAEAYKKYIIKIGNMWYLSRVSANYLYSNIVCECFRKATSHKHESASRGRRPPSHWRRALGPSGGS